MYLQKQYCWSIQGAQTKLVIFRSHYPITYCLGKTNVKNLLYRCMPTSGKLWNFLRVSLFRGMQPLFMNASKNLPEIMLKPLYFRKDSSFLRRTKILCCCLECISRDVNSTLDSVKSVFNICRRKPSLGARLLHCPHPMQWNSK